METAKILKKSVLNPGNNWITLLNSAKIIKKNAVTPVNFHLYHYASNNPVRYTDPDGRKIIGVLKFDIYMKDSNDILGTQPYRVDEKDPSLGDTRVLEDGSIITVKKYMKISGYGCVLTATTRIISSLWCHRIKVEDVNQYAIENNLFIMDKEGDISTLTPENIVKLVNGYLKDKYGYDDLRIEYHGRVSYADLKDLDNDNNQYFVTCRIDESHTVNVDRDYDSKFNKFPLNDTCHKRYDQYDYTKDSYYDVYVIQRKTKDGTYENLQ